MRCSAVLLAVPLERALRRKARQETREQDLGKEAPLTLQGRRGRGRGSLFLVSDKAPEVSVRRPVCGRPPAMPVTGPQRTTGIAAFMGAPGGPSPGLLWMPLLTEAKTPRSSGFFHILDLVLLLNICSLLEDISKNWYHCFQMFISWSWIDRIRLAIYPTKT